jgi:hypothetical protein
MFDTSPFTWTHTYTSTAFESAVDAPEQPVHILAGNAVNPYTFRDPSQIPSNTAYVFDASGGMRLTGRSRPSLAYHWLREVALGMIEGELGLKVSSGVEATIDLRLDGRFHAVISLDSGRWLRLRITKKREKQLNLGVQMSARVTGATNVPEKSAGLIAAIVGVHANQWLAQLVRLAEKGALAAEAVRLGIEETVLKRALDVWRKLDSSSAVAVWSALETGAALAPLVVDAQTADTLKRLKSYAETALSPALLEKTLDGNIEAADAWVRKQLGEFLGAGVGLLDPATLADKVRAVRAMADAILNRVPEALEKICSAELSWRFEAASCETALIDCSFAFTDEGLRLYQDALNGNYTRILAASSEHVRLSTGVLTHDMHRETVIELHLPFVGRKEWKTRFETLARVEVETGADGRILIYSSETADKLFCGSVYQSTLTLASALKVGEVYSDSSFKLSYTDTQTLERGEAAMRLAPMLAAYGFDERVNRWLSDSVPPEAGKIESSLSLSVPGSLVSEWLRTPGERDADFFVVYSRVSVAVQAAMRRWLPFAYFGDIDEYETLGSAFPLLIYQASKPFAGRPRSEFTYDVMEERSMAAMFRTAGQALPRLLETVSSTLAAAGRTETAAFYAPRQAASILATVQHSSRLIRSLLVADAFFIGALVRMGLEGTRLAGELQKDPQRAVKDLARFTAEFVQSYHSRLRRLYSGRDFPAFGAMILVEATAALSGATGAGEPVGAVLRLKAGDVEQTFVNAAYRG